MKFVKTHFLNFQKKKKNPKLFTYKSRLSIRIDHFSKWECVPLPREESQQASGCEATGLAPASADRHSCHPSRVKGKSALS